MGSLKNRLAQVPGLRGLYQWIRAFAKLGADSARLSLLERDFRRRREADIPVTSYFTVSRESMPQVSAPGGSILSDALYVAFEDEFYNTDVVAAKQTVYVPYLQSLFAENGAGSTVDLGCGRGEFLRILRAAHIDATGVEINRQEVESLQHSGFDAVLGDANGYLAQCEDSSLAAVVALQVVEHVDVDYLLELIALAGRKLRANGATFIVETPNPACLAVHGTFYNDLTHVRLYPADTLRFYLSQLDFAEFDVVYTSPCPIEYRIPGAPECNYMDYGLVARR